MTSRFKLWVGLIVLFCAGALTGAVVVSLLLHGEASARGDYGPAAHQERMMKRLTQDLSLTSAQQADVEPIVTRAHVALLELRFAHQAEVERILAQGIAELNTKLSAAQQSELDKMVKGLERRWQVSREYLEAQKQQLKTP